MVHKKRDFETFYRMMKDDVYKVALYYTRNPQAAEEITQLTLYQIFLNFDRLRDKTARSYTLRIAQNFSFNWIKYGFRDLFFYHDEITGKDLPEEHSAEYWCLLQEEHRQALKLSEDILTALKKKNMLWYEAIVMIYVFEIPHEQVAKELGIDRVSLASRLYRAKKWVRERYRDQFDDIYKSE